MQRAVEPPQGEAEPEDPQIPEEILQMTDEELRTEFRYSQACQDCLHYFHPELAEPLQKCQHLTANGTSEGDLVLHRGPADLVNGVAQGCWWCNRVFFEFQREHGATTIKDFPQKYPGFRSYSQGLEDWNGGSATCFLKWKLADEGMADALWLGRKDWTCASRGIYVKPNTADSESKFEYLPLWMYRVGDLDDSTGSQHSMDYIDTQLRNCRETHDDCHASSISSSTTPWYPRRLMQIISTGDRHITALRLVETQESSIDGPYCTLSYCWGGKPNLSLLTAKYEEYRCITGIPASKVPQLFLDAASVALRIGAYFIWIDSLCIIQDSKEDWLRESVTMQNVYQYGLCNIMAASARHSGEALFSNRDARLIAPCIIRGSDKISTYVEGLEDINEEDEWFRSLSAEPLYQRGWVLQERLLAIRSVIFTHHNVFFQCSHGTNREVHPSHEGPGYAFDSSDPAIVAPDEKMSPHKLTPETCFDTWRLILNAYTKTALSFPGDTFIALSGLAERVKQVCSSRYLHGHWEADLVKSLAWWDETQERRLGFDVPSWSWASVNRPYHFDYSQSDAVMRASGTPTDGQLQLQGRMFSIRAGSSGPLNADRIQQDIMRRVGSAADRSDAVACLDGPDAEREETPLPGQLLCVPLVRSRSRITYFGLLLAPTQLPCGSYRRVGFFRLDLYFDGTPSHVDTDVGWVPGNRKKGQEFVEECYGRLLETFKSPQGDIRSHAYDEATEQHTVFIV